MVTTKEQEKELLLQADPVLRKQYEAKLLREADPQLNKDAYPQDQYGILYNQGSQGMASLNNLGAIPPTTPPGRNPVVMPGATPILYDNLPAAQPPRAPMSWGELFKGMYQNGGESLKKFFHSVYETAIDPYGAANAITNGIPTVDKVESAVNATPATLGGIVLDQLSPEVRALVVKDHPELQPAEEKGKTASEAAHNVAKATADYLGTYGSAENEPWFTGLSYNLKDRPFQTLSDLSIPVSLGAAGVAKMGLNAAWRTALAEKMIAQGVPGAIAQATVNAPRVAVNAMNPINWVTYPAGKVVSGTTRAVANALTPQRRAMMGLVNDDIQKAKQVEAKLKHTMANPIVKGSNPTAAEGLEYNPHGPEVPPGAGTPSNALLGPGSGPAMQLPAGGNNPMLPGGSVPQLPGGPAPMPQLPGGPAAAGLLNEAPSVDSLLLDGHSLDAINAPRPAAPGGSVPPAAVLLDEAAAAPVRPTNVLNRDTPPGAGPGAAPEAPPTMNNALNQARPIEPEAPPRQVPQPEPEAPPQQEAPRTEPEAAPQPEVEAPPEPAKAEPVVPESTFDFMGRTKEVQQFIDQHPHMEAMFQKAITKSEKDIAKAEEGLRSSSKYGDKFIEMAKMKNLAQQEAAFKSWIEEEPNAEEVTRHFNNLKKSTLTAEAAKRRITEIASDLEEHRSIMEKLIRGEEGHLDINAIADDINKKIADYHAANAAAGVITLPPHPGVGPRGVARTGTPGVLAQKFSAAGEQARLNRPDPFTETYNQNNAARMRVNNETGKTGPAGNVDRPTAEAQHDALSKVEFDRARTKLSTSDATLERLLRRPLSDEVLGRARNLLGERGKTFGTGPYVPAHVDATGKFVPAVYPQYSGEELHALVQSLSDIAFDSNTVLKGGMSKTELDAVKGTRAEVLRWIGLRGKNPELITAMKNYAARSNQIDRMKLAEHLESILQKDSKDEFTLRQRADAYADAIHPNKQAATLKAATDRQMHDNFSQLVTPKELDNIELLKADLQREVMAKDHAIAGRDFGDSINTAATDGIGATHIPGHNGMLNQLREILMGSTDKRVKERIGKGLETVPGGLKLMSNALRQQEGFDIIGEATRRLGRTVNNVTTKVPTVYNVTEQQRDAKKKKGGTR